jgi:branched-chain amino acid aminotransferase
MSILWINGELLDKSAARVSPFDHGLLYGDGVWEHLRVFGGNLFRPDDQLKHLFAAAAALAIDIPLSPDELRAAVDATVAANRRTEGYVRVIVTRGPGTIGPDPRKIDPQVFVTAEEYLPFPAELAESGLHAAAVPCIDRENPYHAVRALGSPHVVGAKAAALRGGCLEAVLLDRAGRVFGCTEGQLFVVKGGAARRPAFAIPDVVADFAAKQCAATAADIAAAELLQADELFLAGTAAGVVGIVRADGTAVGDGTEGPATRAVREAYRAATRGGNFE